MGKVTFEGNSTSVMSNKFIGMTMDSGITFMGQSKVTFSNNTADNGGSFFTTNSTIITFNESSVAVFK